MELKWFIWCTVVIQFLITIKIGNCVPEEYPIYDESPADVFIADLEPTENFNEKRSLQEIEQELGDMQNDDESIQKLIEQYENTYIKNTTWFTSDNKNNNDDDHIDYQLMEEIDETTDEGHKSPEDIVNTIQDIVENFEKNFGGEIETLKTQSVFVEPANINDESNAVQHEELSFGHPELVKNEKEIEELYHQKHTETTTPIHVVETNPPHVEIESRTVTPSPPITTTPTTSSPTTTTIQPGLLQKFSTMIYGAIGSLRPRQTSASGLDGRSLIDEDSTNVDEMMMKSLEHDDTYDNYLYSNPVYDNPVDDVSRAPVEHDEASMLEIEKIIDPEIRDVYKQDILSVTHPELVHESNENVDTEKDVAYSVETKEMHVEQPAISKEMIESVEVPEIFKRILGEDEQKKNDEVETEQSISSEVPPEVIENHVVDHAVPMPETYVRILGDEESVVIPTSVIPETDLNHQIDNNEHEEKLLLPEDAETFHEIMTGPGNKSILTEYKTRAQIIEEIALVLPSGHNSTCAKNYFPPKMASTDEEDTSEIELQKEVNAQIAELASSTPCEEMKRIQSLFDAGDALQAALKQKRTKSFPPGVLYISRDILDPKIDDMEEMLSRAVANNPNRQSNLDELSFIKQIIVDLTYTPKIEDDLIITTILPEVIVPDIGISNKNEHQFVETPTTLSPSEENEVNSVTTTFITPTTATEYLKPLPKVENHDGVKPTEDDRVEDHPPTINHIEIANLNPVPSIENITEYYEIIKITDSVNPVEKNSTIIQILPDHIRTIDINLVPGTTNDNQNIQTSISTTVKLVDSSNGGLPIIEIKSTNIDSTEAPIVESNHRNQFIDEQRTLEFEAALQKIVENVPVDEDDTQYDFDFEEQGHLDTHTEINKTAEQESTENVEPSTEHASVNNNSEPMNENQDATTSAKVNQLLNKGIIEVQPISEVPVIEENHQTDIIPSKEQSNLEFEAEMKGIVEKKPIENSDSDDNNHDEIVTPTTVSYHKPTPSSFKSSLARIISDLQGLDNDIKHMEKFSRINNKEVLDQLEKNKYSVNNNVEEKIIFQTEDYGLIGIHQHYTTIVPEISTINFKEQPVQDPHKIITEEMFETLVEKVHGNPLVQPPIDHQTEIHVDGGEDHSSEEHIYNELEKLSENHSDESSEENIGPISSSTYENFKGVSERNMRILQMIFGEKFELKPNGSEIMMTRKLAKQPLKNSILVTKLHPVESRASQILLPVTDNMKLEEFRGIHDHTVIKKDSADARNFEENIIDKKTTIIQETGENNQTSEVIVEEDITEEAFKTLVDAVDLSAEIKKTSDNFRDTLVESKSILETDNQIISSKNVRELVEIGMGNDIVTDEELLGMKEQQIIEKAEEITLKSNVLLFGTILGSFTILIIAIIVIFQRTKQYGGLDFVPV